MAIDPVPLMEIDVRGFGAVGNGVANDQPAITKAITTAVASGRPLKLQPNATYGISTPIALKSGLRIVGSGNRKSVIKALTGFSGAALLIGSSGDMVADVELLDVGFDGNYAALSIVMHAVQITNGVRPRILRCRFTNFGGGGVVLQGLSGNGTPDGKVHDCELDGIGLADGTNGHGITIKDASHRASVQRNTLTNIKGGMGISVGASGASALPTDCNVLGNTIWMIPSTTGFEAIGIAAGCVRPVVSSNTSYNSQDNGISCSSGYGAVTGNVIESCLNHGISVGGAHNAVTGNVIRNPGQMRRTDGLSYGGIASDNGSFNSFVGNVIVDDQGSPTMAYAVKLNNSQGNNLIGPNVEFGFIVAAHFGLIGSDKQVIPT